MVFNKAAELREKGKTCQNYTCQAQNDLNPLVFSVYVKSMAPWALISLKYFMLVHMSILFLASSLALSFMSFLLPQQGFLSFLPACKSSWHFFLFYDLFIFVLGI